MATAAGEVLAKEKAVTAIDVCVGIGWLSARPSPATPPR